MLKGIYHTHSDFSYDGTKSLKEITKWCLERHFDFIILTEHNDDFTLEKFNELAFQCKQHSGDLLFIPGIEYEFIINGKVVHVGAIGLDNYYDINQNPVPLESFLDSVRESRGLSVLHHPHRVMCELSDRAVRKFDFVEAWNVVHDISYSPNRRVINQAEQAGFAGQYLASRDIHYYRETDGVPYLNLNIDRANKTPDAIIDALSNGQYLVKAKYCDMQPSGCFLYPRKQYGCLPAVSLMHQNAYERLRVIYKKTIKVTPPKWLVKAIK